MRITGITTFAVDGGFRNWVFVRVDTDEGISGYGEATLEGREHAVVGAIEDMSRQLVDRDPRRIRALSRRLTRNAYWEHGPVISSAVAGIEIACWDILGKHLDAPVSTLLGGTVRDRIPVYSNAWYFGVNDPEGLAERAVATVADGYPGLKFDPFHLVDFAISDSDLGAAIDRVAAVREAVGPEIALMIEGHGRMSVASASRVARRLEPFDITFFEEPVPPGDFAALAEVARISPVPIAAGERCYSVQDCRRLLDGGHLGVLQPDIVHIGGFGPLMVAADLCDSAFVAVSPHNASGPIATAATLHAAATMPNLLLQEMFAPNDASWKDEVVRGVPEIEDGAVDVPPGPGLGIEVDEEAIADHPMVPRDLGMLESDSILDRPVT